jgi:hypothetical protein
MKAAIIMVVAIDLAASTAAFAQSSGPAVSWGGMGFRGAGNTGTFPQRYYYPPRRVSQPVVRGRIQRPRNRAGRG